MLTEVWLRGQVLHFLLNSLNHQIHKSYNPICRPFVFWQITCFGKGKLKPAFLLLVATNYRPQTMFGAK